MRGIATAICLAVLTLFVPQASAVGDVGICAVIYNKTKDTIKVTVSLPTIYSMYIWTIPSGLTEILTMEGGVPVVTTGQRDSDDNLLYVHATGYDVNPAKAITFVYEPKRNVALGCNGTFLGTVHGK